MASVRNLKKDINYVLGDIIDAAYLWEMSTTAKPTEASQAIIVEAIAAYDQLISKVNQKPADTAKNHFRQVRKDLENTAVQLIEKINQL